MELTEVTPHAYTSKPTKEKNLINEEITSSLLSDSSNIIKANIIAINDPLNNFDFTNKTVMEEYYELDLLAKNGDSNAQYLLGVLLYRCMNSPRSSEQLDEQINRMYSETSDGFSAEESLKDNYRICKGLTEHMISRYLNLVESSALQGNIVALNAYANLAIMDDNYSESELPKVVKTYQSNRDKFLDTAIEQGNLEALRTKALDLFSSDNQKVRSYAYLKVVQLYNPSKSISNVIQVISRDIYEHEIYEAEELFLKLANDFGKQGGVITIKKNKP